MRSMYFALGAGMDLVVVLMPVIASTFRVPIAVAVQIVTARAFGKLLSPFLGHLSDRFGRKKVLLASVGVFALGNLGVVAVSSFGTLVATQFVAGLGMAGMQVSLPTFVGDLIPYEKRGRGLGLAQMWLPIGILLGVPTTALLTQAFGLRAPFLVLAGVLAIQIPLGFKYLTPLPAHRASNKVGRFTDSLKPKGWSFLLSEGWIFAIVPPFFMLIMSAAVYIFLSTWLTEIFDYRLSQIGAIWSGMAVMSIGAIWLVALLSDRIGKYPTAFGSMILAIASTAFLSRVTTPWMAISALYLFALANDFSFVAYGVIVTELKPTNRGTMMSAYIFSTGLAIVLAPFLGSFIWPRGGFPLLTLLVSSAGLLALFIARWAYAGWKPETIEIEVAID